mgnify:CR=1 FL=1
MSFGVNVADVESFVVKLTVVVFVFPALSVAVMFI